MRCNYSFISAGPSPRKPTAGQRDSRQNLDEWWPYAPQQDQFYEGKAHIDLSIELSISRSASRTRPARSISSTSASQLAFHQSFGVYKVPSAKILWSPPVTRCFGSRPPASLRPKCTCLAIQAATFALTVERKRDRCRHQPGDTKAESRTGSPTASFARRSASAVRFTVAPCSAKAPDS
jgi:hypothetical protein